MPPARRLALFKYLTGFLIAATLIATIIAHPPVWQTFAFYPPYSNRVTFDGVGIGFISLLVLNYLITGFLGYGIIRHSLLHVDIQSITKFFAGFFLGYLGICGLERISTIFFIGPSSYFTTTIAALLLGYYFLKRDTKNFNISQSKNQFALKNLFIFSISALIFLIAALMLQITQGELSWVGHGNYPSYLYPIWPGQGYVTLPIIIQHYDEFSYHYWLNHFYTQKVNPVIPWWITLSLIKLSTFCFLYAVLRKLNVTLWFAIIFTIFLMFGTSSPLFNKYYLLFDSSNPLFFTVHSGRIVGVGLVIFLLLNLFKNTDLSLNAFGKALLLGIGISTTSLSNGLWVIAICIAILFLKSRKPKSHFAYINNLAFWIAPLMVLLVFLMYPVYLGTLLMHPLSFWSHLNLTDRLPQIEIYVKLVTCLIYLIFCAYAFFTFYKNTQHTLLSRKELFIYLTLILSILFGVSLLGNVLASLIYKNPVVIHFLSLHHLGVDAINEGMIDHVWGWQTLIGDHRELSQAVYNAYCFSIYHFAACYGVLLIAILITNLLFILKANKNSELHIADQRLFYIFLVCIAAIPPLFFFMDYVDLSSRAWIKSRFLEIPVYSLLFISLYFMYKFFTKKQQIFLAIFCWFYSITPFILTDRFKQIWANASLLIQIIKGTPGYKVLM